MATVHTVEKGDILLSMWARVTHFDKEERASEEDKQVYYLGPHSSIGSLIQAETLTDEAILPGSIPVLVTE